MYNDMNKGKKSIANFSLLYQTYTPTAFSKHKPKSGPPLWRQVVHPQPQTLQGESVAKPETLLGPDSI